MGESFRRIPWGESVSYWVANTSAVRGALLAHLRITRYAYCARWRITSALYGSNPMTPFRRDANKITIH